ncbi:RNA polymerase sigma factor SigM [Mycolicibacterium monacense]|uniref:DNA-directed RNA polymerase sigma-70 factor n=2 Tax=Mycobacteriaceae TaxID=1762 RepID=A0AAD1J0P4_MYCMB|nr:RNA polymerase sigma factor SigM [Mycolicibacterium monacense]MDA4103489.1 RNA polymerase sigma factor SigM [Mycolicibacterium monacense DSM 44395]ORB12738.1 RNA polymerase sigma factor SigM [Mycolicibacterium monacense DSM 44395]QHP89073.1 RNA polymerase sigma factor SigM [Mycolicibacterium monacense DSM 44395]BBZ63450.1 DNA-directed RNA polymerase sigma-70 factor [Mycolicibacterium monacense]
MVSFDAVGRSDAQLLADHVAGDRYAFAELFVRHQRQLERLARITSSNREDAADALQEAMLSAHRKAASFRFDSAVSSWLYRIVVNACLDRLRTNRTHATSTLVDDVGSAGDPTARVDTAIVIERALLRLPVEQRAAVVAVDMQGYSVAETARMLGVAEGTVKSRCSRGRAKLAETLRGLDETETASPPPAGRGCHPVPRSARSRRRPTIERAVRHAGGGTPVDRP